MERFIHPTAEVSEKAEIGEGTRIWNQSQVREGASIGKNCILGKNVYVDSRARIGSNVKLENNVSVYDVVIEDGVELGPGVVITNDRYPRAFIWNDGRRAGTLIRKGASIGANATTIGGITIGEYAMIGAGSVVTRDVPSHCLVYGNPAVIRGFVCKCGKKLGRPEREEKGRVLLKCSECNEMIMVPKETFEKAVA